MTTYVQFGPIEISLERPGIFPRQAPGISQWNVVLHDGHSDKWTAGARQYDQPSCSQKRFASRDPHHLRWSYGLIGFTALKLQKPNIALPMKHAATKWYTTWKVQKYYVLNYNICLQAKDYLWRLKYNNVNTLPTGG